MDMEELNDERVVRVLAEREGWTFCSDGWWRGPTGLAVEKPSYLTSKDALAPVLEGLSEEEMKQLTQLLYRQSMAGIHSSPMLAYMKLTRYLLTIPARDLAHAVAKVIKND